MDIIALIKAERDKVARQLNGLNAALAAFAGTYKTGSSRPRRKMSAAARARISAAQKARWAKARGQKVFPIKAGKPHLSGRSGADQSGKSGEMGEGESREKIAASTWPDFWEIASACAQIFFTHAGGDWD